MNGQDIWPRSARSSRRLVGIALDKRGPQRGPYRLSAPGATCPVNPQVPPYEGESTAVQPPVRPGGAPWPPPQRSQDVLLQNVGTRLPSAEGVRRQGLVGPVTRKTEPSSPQIPCSWMAEDSVPRWILAVNAISPGSHETRGGSSAQTPASAIAGPSLLENTRQSRRRTMPNKNPNIPPRQEAR